MSTVTKSALIEAVNKPFKGALSRLFGKPLQVTLGQRTLTFSKPGDFEFALTGRVSVSFIKIVELLHRSAGGLRREAVFVRLVEHQLLRALERCRAEPDKVSELLKDIGLKSFSTDYRWRAIFESLASQGPEFNEYRGIALIKYLQYLSARRDALGIVYFHRTGKVLEEDNEIIMTAPDAANSDETALEASGNSPEYTLPGFRRLPRGKPVSVQIDPATGLRIVLARHRLTLQADDGIALIDEHGRCFPLEPRKNSIGRGLGNDITLDGSYRTVSRRHAIIEPLPDGRVRITDLSALGVYVPESSYVPEEIVEAA